MLMAWVLDARLSVQGLVLLGFRVPGLGLRVNWGFGVWGINIWVCGVEV